MRSLTLLFAATTVLSCAATAQKLDLNGAGRVAHAVVEPAPPQVEQAMENFQLPPDLEVSLWAAEPMLANPVAIAFDEQGRLFVSETYRYGSSTLDIRGYMGMLELDLASRTVGDRAAMIESVFEEESAFLAVESERIRLVSDTDGDGKADRSAIYASDFDTKLDGVASGVLPRKGKVWFTNIPALWLLEGEDEAGQAISRTPVFHGFGVHFGFTGHDLHGLIIGPDGKLYFSIGDRGTHLTTKEGNIIDLPDTGAVFRCDLDGTNLEVFATGLRNPQELAFDEFGNLFTGDNDADAGDRERLVHLVEGGDSGWRIGYQFAPTGKAGPWMREDMWKPRFEGQAAYLIPPIVNINDGPSGIAYYPGTGLSPDYQGHLFITHFKGSLTRSGIDSYSMEPHGATFRLKEAKTFIKGTLPTDVTFGPDGALYFSDWVQGWPKSKRGRIYRVHHPDTQASAIVQQTAQLIAHGMEERPPEELASLLGHADQRVRLEAQLELAARGPGSIQILATVAHDTHAARLARLHALWGLGQLGRLSQDAKSSIVRLLGDPDSELRAQAAKLIGDLGMADEQGKLVDLLQNPAARVRFFAAQSLGKLGDGNSVPHLVELLRENDDKDLYLRHAAVMGLVGCADAHELAALSDDPSPAVRLGAVLALRRLDAPEIAHFLADSDPYIVRETALAINGAAIAEAFPALADLMDTPAMQDRATAMRVLNAAFRHGQPENATQLARFAAQDEALLELRQEALHLLSQWAEPPARDRLLGIYRPLPARPSDAAVKAFNRYARKLLLDAPVSVAISAHELVARYQVSRQASRLLQTVERNDLLTPIRISALNTLDALSDLRLARAAEIASASGDPELRLASLPILAALDPQQAAPALRSLVKTGSPQELKAAFPALARIDQPYATEILAESLQRLLDGELPLAAGLELVQAAQSKNDPALQALLLEREERLAASDDPLAPYRLALRGGDAQRGKWQFDNNPALACIRCHVVNGEGGEAGPELTRIGQLKDRRYLLESIVAPSAAIAEGFETVILTLKDGRTEAGTLVRETEEALVISLPDGQEAAIGKSQIAHRATAPSSMPPTLASLMTPNQLRDLVEYLASLKGPAEIQDAPSESEGHGLAEGEA